MRRLASPILDPRPWLFAAPFLAVIAWDGLVIRRWIELTANDVATGMYAMGLNWLALDVWPTFHIPMDTYRQLAALVVFLSGLHAPNLDSFTVVGVAVQVVLVFVAGFWAARVSRQLSVAAWHLFILAAVTAAMPMVMAESLHFSNYFAQGVFTTPLGMSVYLIFKQERLAPRLVNGTLFVLGLLVANYYLAAVLVVGVFAAVAVRGLVERGAAWNWGAPLLDRFAAARWFNLPLVGFLFIGVNFWLPVYKLVFHAPTYDMDWRAAGWSCVISALISLPLTVVALRISRLMGRWGVLLGALAAPLLWGWLVGTNVLSPYFLISAVSASSHFGAGPAGGIGGFPAFLDYAWHWLLLLGFAVGLAMAFGRWGARKVGAPVGTFAVVTLVANFLLGLNVTLTATSLQAFPFDFGLVSRFYISALAPLAALYLAVIDGGRRVPVLGTAAAMVLVSAFSAFQWATTLGPATEAARRVDHELANQIDTFLAKNPDGQVYCMNTEAPKACDTLYAWNRYRKIGESPRFLRRSLPGGRIHYAYRLNTACATRTDRSCWPAGRGGPLLVLYEGGPKLAYEGAKVVASEPRFRSVISVARFAGK